MPWPVDDLSTAGVDSGTDTPPRAEFFKLFQRVKALIAGRGAADGVASLDARRRVPDVELGRGVAEGVAALDGTGRVPAAQLPEQAAPPAAIPAGALMSFAGSATPDGWLLCDGREVSRTAHAALFIAIGTRWGAGDGTTTFNLPDYAGRFVLGAGGGYALATQGGAATHTLTVDEMPTHRHGMATGRYGGQNDEPGAKEPFTGALDDAPTATGDAGGGQAHNNMPPYAVARVIIKT